MNSTNEEPPVERIAAVIDISRARAADGHDEAGEGLLLCMSRQTSSQGIEYVDAAGRGHS